MKLRFFFIKKKAEPFLLVRFSKSCIGTILYDNNQCHVYCMKIQLAENEFTTAEVLLFLRLAYSTQINGKPFTAATIRNWIRINHFPAAYSGYRIVSTKIYKQLGGIRVLDIEGLTRKDVEEMIGSMNDNTNIKINVLPIKNKKPRKQRTKLYYKILEAAGKQYTKKTLKQATLPLYWKEAGIKRNQMVNTSRVRK